MENCLGVISFSNNDYGFGVLCKNRPAAMLPFGGRYRVIDFILSSMVNHDIQSVGVFTGTKIRSVMDHIGNGKPWELNRRFKGLFIFPPLYDNDATYRRLGNIAQFHNNEQFFRASKEENIMVANTSVLAKVDLDAAYKHFIETDADVTMIYTRTKDPTGRYINNDKLYIDDDGVLINLGTNLGTEEEFNLYLGTVFIKKEIYFRIVREAIEKGNANYLKEALLVNRGKAKINTYRHEGHVFCLKNAKNYYDANMSLLNSDIYKELFYSHGPILTNSKDEPSTNYKETAKVNNSLIANGCIIEGSVKNSIIFRGVKVGKNAIVKNAVIMQKCIIADNAVVVNAILDKNTNIGKRVEIAGSSTVPYVIEKDYIIRQESEI
ncbi:MAG: glucose-1-phosphate adenylyltransferase subunit GlgD [Eubacteriaceae bacterium]|nr:glucose-1-phosphate adenylyltransferase subunit GlgD [Eubacteriaceae bacterium]